MTYFTIHEDQRDIYRIKTNSQEWQVGENCRRIEAYNESGQMSYVTWFAIYDDVCDQPMCRVNGAHVVVVDYNYGAQL